MVSKRPNCDPLQGDRLCKNPKLGDPRKQVHEPPTSSVRSTLKSTKMDRPDNMLVSRSEVVEDTHELSETDDEATDIDCGVSSTPSPRKECPSKDKLALTQEELDVVELETHEKVQALEQMVAVLKEREILLEMWLTRYVRCTNNNPPDVCFMVENTPLYSYKKLLASASPKFKKMFENLSQNRDPCLTSSSIDTEVIHLVLDKITIPNVSRHVFSHFLAMFSSKGNIADLNLMFDVLLLAYEYDVRGMIDILETKLVPLMCAKYLRKCLEVARETKSQVLDTFVTRFEPRVDEENVIDLLIAAHEFKNKVLKRRIIRQLKCLRALTDIPGWSRVNEYAGLKDEIIVLLQKSDTASSPDAAGTSGKV